MPWRRSCPFIERRYALHESMSVQSSSSRTNRRLRHSTVFFYPPFNCLSRRTSSESLISSALIIKTEVESFTFHNCVGIRACVRLRTDCPLRTFLPFKLGSASAYPLPHAARDDVIGAGSFPLISIYCTMLQIVGCPLIPLHRECKIS